LGLSGSLALPKTSWAGLSVDPSGASPSEFYWTVERKASAACKDHPDVSSFIYDRSDRNRRFFPCATAARYGDAGVSYWALKGDVVARYVLALKRLPEIDPSQVNGITDFKFTRKEIKLLSGLASSEACGPSHIDASGRDFLGCTAGLPEAQYALAVCYNRGSIGCHVHRTLADEYCHKSLNGGYAPAIHGCGKIETHGRSH
jgi:hypothetical protein